MSINPDEREQVLAATQMLVSSTGYGGVVLSDVAEASGVPYERLAELFGTKDDLMVEVMRGYGIAFFQSLHERSREDAGPKANIELFIAVIRDVLTIEDRMCLCGMLAADTDLLSEPVRQQTADFMNACIRWLEQQWRDLGHANAHAAAVNALARLEGGMLLSRVTKDVKHYDVVADDIRAEAGRLG